MEPNEFAQRVQAVGRAFSPAAPITDQDLFAGRQAQLRTLVMVMGQRGQHALIYGERGIGKTSLARVAEAIVRDTIPSAYYVCHSDDTFSSIWRGVFNEVALVSEVPSFGFSDTAKQVMHSAAGLISGEVSPHTVAQALGLVATGQNQFLVVIDEFDRPVDAQSRILIADTVKIAADRAIPATVVLVGVGDTVEALIAEHGSIQRSLVQVPMPRMTHEELCEIVRRGMHLAELDVSSLIVEQIASLSQGLPHYTHLLGYHSAITALDDGRLVVEDGDLEGAIKKSLEAAHESVKRRYHQATFSNRETLYKQVLLACAMAKQDEVGSFGAPDVREKLRAITSHNYDIPAFATHLKDFSSEHSDQQRRGGILQRIGTTRQFRYRFLDPLMPPYIVMKGRDDKLI